MIIWNYGSMVKKYSIILWSKSIGYGSCEYNIYFCKMEDKVLLQRISDAAYEVRQHLMPGYLEAVYEEALMVELRLRGLRAENQRPMTVFYKGVPVGNYVADIIVEDKIILELKAVREVSKIHGAQLVNYLVATGLNIGVLINYGENYAFRIKERIYSHQ